MTDRRMFSHKIVDSDRFLDLPPEARLLYYELSIRCDDDGFCACPGKILRMTGASADNLRTLLEAGLLLDFGKVVVVSDWRIHNTLKSDRVRAVDYPDIAEKIWITRSGSYTTDPDQGLMTLMEYHVRYAQERRDPLRDYRGKSMENLCNLLDPEEKRKEEKRKEEKRREENRSEEKRDEEEAARGLAPEGPDSDGCSESEEFVSSDSKRLETFGGELGQNVVWLTDEQTSDLLDRLSLEEFNRYVRRLSDYILKHGDPFHSHYRTILKWWEEDRTVQDRSVLLE